MNANMEKGSTSVESLSTPHDKSATPTNRTATTSVTASAVDADAAEIKIDELGPPPDGGWTAWGTVIGAALANFCSFGLANSFGVFQAYYQTGPLKEYSSSSIAWIGSIQVFLTFAAGILIGRLFDARGVHACLVPGTVLHVFGLMMTSLCTEYYQFLLAQGVVGGLAFCFLFTGSVVVPSQWFARRRALAIALVVMGSGLGGTIWPIATSRMIVQIGFPWTIRVLGFISLALLIPANLLVRTRLPRKKMGSFKTILLPLKEPTFFLLNSGIALTFSGIFTPFFFASTNALRIGAPRELAFYMLAFVNAGSTFGRLGAALGDVFGRFNMAIAASFLSAILLLAFWIPLNSTAALIACLVLYGFTAGMFITLTNAVTAQISTMSEIGQRIGLMCTVLSVFALVGPPINGALLAAAGEGNARRGYQYAGAFSGAMVLTGCALVVAARRCQTREWIKII